MNLREKLQNDIKDAMLSGDDRVRDTLRMVEGMISNKEIEARSQGKVFDDVVVENIITSAVKQRRDSVAQFRAGSREDLATREEAEIAILERYLPEPVSEDELRRVIERIGERSGLSGMQDMGQMMGLVMAETKALGSVDGSQVKKLVEEYLRSV